ncbi:hypothetical protein JNW90_30175 [Micromonospora sp. STR1s_5]|nr:hypothetical protein [Micromonospora sp. STR1s_5]
MIYTGADVDKRVAEAWARIEAGLSRVLPASRRQLNAAAAVQAIDAVEADLAVQLPQDFRATEVERLMSVGVSA